MKRRTGAEPAGPGAGPGAEPTPPAAGAAQRDGAAFPSIARSGGTHLPSLSPGLLPPPASPPACACTVGGLFFSGRVSKRAVARGLLALAAPREQPSPGRRARGAPRSPARGREGRFGRGLPSGESRAEPQRLPGAAGAEPQRARRGPARCRRCHRGGGRTSAGRYHRRGETSRSGTGRGVRDPCATTPAPGTAPADAAPAAGRRLPRGLAWERKSSQTWGRAGGRSAPPRVPQTACE